MKRRENMKVPVHRMEPTAVLLEKSIGISSKNSSLYLVLYDRQSVKYKDSFVDVFVQYFETLYT